MWEAEDIKDGIVEETDDIQSEREEARDCVVVTTAVVSRNAAASPAVVVATTMCKPLRIPLQALSLRPSVLLVLQCLSSLCWTPLIRRSAEGDARDQRKSEARRNSEGDARVRLGGVRLREDADD